MKIEDFQILNKKRLRPGDGRGRKSVFNENEFYIEKHTEAFEFEANCEAPKGPRSSPRIQMRKIESS